MKIEMIDLVEFFKDKYRFADNNLGLGALSLITESQMVTRLNGTTDNKKAVTHFRTEGSILRDIFDLPEELFLNFGYNPNVLSTLDSDYRRLLKEMVTIKYINNGTGNLMLIFLPGAQKTITENQLEAIRYVNDCVEKASYWVSRPM